MEHVWAQRRETLILLRNEAAWGEGRKSFPWAVILGQNLGGARGALQLEGDQCGMEARSCTEAA